MRIFSILSLFVCLLSMIIARPSNVQDRTEDEADEAEYDNSDETPAEDSVQEDDSRFNDEEPRNIDRDKELARQQLTGSNREREFNMGRALAERSDKPDNDNTMGYSRNSKNERQAEESPSYNNLLVPKRKQLNRYFDGNDANDNLDQEQHLTNKYNANHIQNDDRNNELNKRTVNTHGLAPFEDSDLIFDSQNEHKNNGEKVEYNNEVVDSAGQSRHFKQYYNTMQAEHKTKQGDRNYEMVKYVNRDRRQTEQLESSNSSYTSTEKESPLSNKVNEDDEAAIKRHIKKLTGEELEELLNSLSDDKKVLLNKIMDNNLNLDLNKREITKKAGAVEENNYIDSNLSELSKNQGLSSTADTNTESVVAQSSNSENTKQENHTENSDSTNTKSSEETRGNTPDKAEITNSVDETSNNVNLNANEETNMSAKIENKREANPYYLNDQEESFDDTQLLDNYLNNNDLDDAFDDQNNFCLSHEGGLPQLTEDEVQLHKGFKREVFSDTGANLDDSIRSLEESFPNSNSDESGQNIASNMAPLIRVKRKDDKAIKKRTTGILSNAKVAYVPYKAENEDEGNDEGSEFDDDGFYDRTSNYDKNIINKLDERATCENYMMHSPEEKPKEVISNNQAKVLGNSKSDITSLGSDTDSVLPGLEDVDDNLMYSDRSRNRRTLGRNLLQQSDIEKNHILRSTPFTDDTNSVNIPNYQENDAFGALPKDYNSEQVRYKRIRHVKSSKSEIATSDP